MPRRFVGRLVVVQEDQGYDPKYVPDGPGTGARIEGLYKAFVDREMGNDEIVREHCRSLNE